MRLLVKLPLGCARNVLWCVAAPLCVSVAESACKSVQLRVLWLASCYACTSPPPLLLAMGKSRQPRRFRRPHHPLCGPAGLSTEPEAEEECEEENCPVETLLETLQSGSADARECACASLSRLALGARTVPALLGRGAVRLLGPLLLDPAASVRETAAGALRNMSVAGGPDACEDMVASDIMTPLVALLRECAAFLDSAGDAQPKGRGAGGGGGGGGAGLPGDVAVEAVHLLLNLCESSARAVSVFNKEALLPPLLQFVRRHQQHLPLAIAAAQCLQTVAEDNVELAGSLTAPALAALEPALLLPPAGVDNDSAGAQQSLLRTLVAGFLWNVKSAIPGASLAQALSAVVSALSDALALDARPALAALEAPPAPPGPEASGAGERRHKGRANGVGGGGGGAVPRNPAPAQAKRHSKRKNCGEVVDQANEENKGGEGKAGGGGGGGGGGGEEEQKEENGGGEEDEEEDEADMEAEPSVATGDARPPSSGDDLSDLLPPSEAALVEVMALLSAQQTALEILVNMCCSDDGPDDDEEEEEWEEVGSNDGSEEAAACGDGEEEEEALLSPLCLSAEVHGALLRHGIVGQVIEKSAFPEESGVGVCLKNPEWKPLLTRLQCIQCRALTCLQNMLGSLDEEALGGPLALQELARHLASLLFSASDLAKATEFLEAATGAVRALLHVMASKDIPQCMSVQQLLALCEACVRCEHEGVRLNTVGILGVVGRELSRQRGTATTLQELGSVLLGVAARDASLPVSGEALDALFDVFAHGDDADLAARAMGLAAALRGLAPAFKARMKSEGRRSCSPEQLLVLTNVRTNLARFIRYQESKAR
ncbi:HEAT repeat-containing protein 3 [Lethenteron reissneri]|uniref:HEAT repeat-containing protein 3 n=1 Tax=Lethenteron reissneri TaxID=7753 RepID=UPI002AB67FCB|nr:HEAT repeat-containing protein 3 [Lethenteron reissneri]